MSAPEAVSLPLTESTHWISAPVMSMKISPEAVAFTVPAEPLNTHTEKGFSLLPMEPAPLIFRVCTHRGLTVLSAAITGAWDRLPPTAPVQLICAVPS